MSFYRIQVVIIAVFILAGAAPLLAIQPFLDTTFNSPEGYNSWIGKASMNEEGKAVSLQADGKILIAGGTSVGLENLHGMFLCRLLPDGRLDATFGNGDGAVVIRPRRAVVEESNGLAVQADGKILVLGTIRTIGGHDSAFFLRRYNGDGTPDVSFGGGNGKMTFQKGKMITGGRRLLLQPDGRIIVIGSVVDDSTPPKLLVVRFNSDGTPDNSFGSKGIVRDEAVTEPQDAALQPNGKILITCLNPYPRDLQALRLNTDGSRDSFFGGDGIVIVSKYMEAGSGLAVQPDGKILIGTKRAVYRFTGKGKPDTGFGNGAGSAAFEGIPGGIAVQQSGKIIVVGAGGDLDTPWVSLNHVFTVWRFTAAGQPDILFGGGDGQVTYDKRGMGCAVALQTDGKILAVGSGKPRTESCTFDLLVMRCKSGGALDASFGGDGIVLHGFNTSDDYAAGRAVAFQPGQGIIVLGYRDNGRDRDIMLLRYKRNGLLDKSFGRGKGYAIFHRPDDEIGNGLAMQPDGKIVVAATKDIHWEYPRDSAILLLRFNADGTPDNTFGAGGAVSYGGGWIEGNGVAVLADGHILVTGDKRTPGHGFMILAKFDADGKLDASFGAAGVVALEGYGGKKVIPAQGTDGKILVLAEDGMGISVLRFSADGNLDAGFGVAGAADFHQYYNEWGANLLAQPDGKVLVVGTSLPDPATGGNYRNLIDGFIIRFDQDGNLDAGFGNNGIVSKDSGGEDHMSDAVLDGGGNIIVSGWHAKGSPLNSDITVMKYSKDGVPDATFGYYGTVRFDLKNEYGLGTVLQPNNKIIVVGVTDFNPNPPPIDLSYRGDLLIVRFDPSVP